MRLRLRTRDVEDTRALGEELSTLLAPGDAVMLAGDLGTGKTALVQGMARGLGVEERVTSPSFMIVREYEGRVPLVHVDVYRLDRVQELYDLGFEEVLAPEVVTVVEWGDRVAPVLPAERLEVRLARGAGDDERVVDVEACGAAWSGRRERLAAALERWS